MGVFFIKSAQPAFAEVSAKSCGGWRRLTYRLLSDSYRVVVVVPRQQRFQAVQRRELRLVQQNRRERHPVAFTLDALVPVGPEQTPVCQF